MHPSKSHVKLKPPIACLYIQANGVILSFGRADSNAVLVEQLCVAWERKRQSCPQMFSASLVNLAGKCVF